jgi:Glycosyl transferase family 2
MTDTVPRLSILVASTAPLQDASACLRTLTQQCHGQRVEIILAYSADAEAAEAMAADYPEVILVRLPRAAPLPRLLGTAMARATGDIIAATDATCAVDARWVSAILKAHEAPHPVIGGAVEADKFDKLVDWAAYFCDYGQFMLPLTEGVANEMPGNNLSMKRWALARGREYVDREFWKTYWCQRLQAEGLHLYSEPSIVVYYRKSFRLWPYLVHRFHNGRCFAGMRNAQLTWVKRAIYWMGSPVLPVLFSTRILRAVLPKQRHLRQFFLSLPIIVLATVSWAFGEFCGYLLGCGTSCRHVK